MNVFCPTNVKKSLKNSLINTSLEKIEKLQPETEQKLQPFRKSKFIFSQPLYQRVHKFVQRLTENEKTRISTVRNTLKDF